MTTFELNPQTGEAIFRGFTPDSIGAAPYTAFENLSSRTTGVEVQLNQIQSDVSGLNTYTGYINGRIDNLSPSNIGLSSISQEAGNINLGASTNIDGILSAYGLIEARESYAYGRLRPWSESGRFSLKLEIEGDNNTSELEFSIFRGLNTSNSKSGLAMYCPNGTDTVNAYIAGAGNSFVCANNGNFGIGTNNPTDKLSVSGGFIKCSTGIRIGSNQNSISYANAIPTSGTYARGDILFNLAPSAGGFIGWVCVLAGTPGTWKTWGAISA